MESKDLECRHNDRQKGRGLADLMKEGRYVVCVGGQVEGQQGMWHQGRIQTILSWCGWREKWGRCDHKGGVGKGCSGGEKCQSQVGVIVKVDNG